MALITKLYPPIINGVLPAFYKHQAVENRDWVVKIVVPFSMSRMVPNEKVKSMFLRLKTVQTNEVQYCSYTREFNIDEGVAYFYLTEAEANQLHEGLFYKAQLAYCGVAVSETVKPTIADAGYFSTVGITKCIAKPTVEIANFDAKKVNLYSNRFLGVYKQDTIKGDCNEKVYSYIFTITDVNGNEYLTSGVQLHNINTDIDHDSSQDEFYVHKLIPEGELYFIQYTVTTVNGLVISSPQYRIMAAESIAMEKKITVLPELNYDEGYIQINFRGPRRYELDSENQSLLVTEEDACAGLYLLSRGYLKDDYMVWEDIARFNLNNELPSKHYERDFTIEQGVTYQYRLQQYNLFGIYSAPVYSKEIYADFEDMFLYDGKRQLKVRFNPKVSSFKVDIPEQKIETIGSKYPFIFRNGNVYYHEFPISGLISYQLDEAKLFLDGSGIVDATMLENNFEYRYPYRGTNGDLTYFKEPHSTIMTIKDPKVHDTFSSPQMTPTSSAAPVQYTAQEVLQTLHYQNDSPSLKFGYQKVPTNEIRKDKDLTSENLMSERYFKLSVLQWLTNGEIKLFRSPGEGNYLVRLLNTSMTPNDTLGRMLHTFNTTAYEIDDLNYDNLLKYKLIEITEPNKTLLQSHTKEFYPQYINNEPQLSQIYTYTGKYELLEFEVNDCMPGDQIFIHYRDDWSTDTITIGTTGSYHFVDNERPIDWIKFKPDPNNIFTYPRSITLFYYGEQQHYFDLVKKISTTTIVGRTYYGPQENLVNSVAGDTANYHKFNIQIGRTETAYKTKLLNMEILKIRAREIIPLYRWQEGNTFVYNTTPFGKGYPIEEFKEFTTSNVVNDKRIITSRFAIFKVYSYNEGNQNDLFPVASSHYRNEYKRTSTDDTPPSPSSTPPLNVTDDTLHSDMYPNWTFRFYWDPLLPESSWMYGAAPNTKFAINTNENNDNLCYIDLADQREIELRDLGPISVLKLGNGLMAEVTMRILVTDYSLEDTDADVAERKSNYLLAKEAMINDYQTYMDTYETRYNDYNTYLSDKAKYDAAQAELQTLGPALQVLNSLINDPSVQTEEIKKATSTAITAINTYNTEYYKVLTPEYFSVNGNHPQAPTDIEFFSKPNAINLPSTSTISEVRNALETLANTYYRRLLNDYQNSIPTTDDLISQLPSGWSDTYWESHSVAQLVKELTTLLLQKLQYMYSLLRKSTITTNPFNSTYFSSRNLPVGNNSATDNSTAHQWTSAQGNIVFTDQDTIAGIQHVSYNSIFPEVITDETITYRGQIVTDKEDADAKANHIAVVHAETQRALDTWESAKEALNNANQFIRTQQQTIAESRQVIETETNNINAANNLLTGLYNEEPSEGRDAAISFLQKGITVSQNNIQLNQNIIAYCEQQITEYSATEGYQNIVHAETAAHNAYLAAQQEETNTRNAAQNARNKVDNDITDWNNTLDTMRTYITILQNICKFHNIKLTELQAQINQYRGWYQTLVSKHNEEYNKANNAIADIENVRLAFAQLNDLRDEWTQKQQELLNIDAPTPVDAPTAFDWETYINNIKSAWEAYILYLERAYQDFEMRYYQ